MILIVVLVLALGTSTYSSFVLFRSFNHSTSM